MSIFYPKKMNVMKLSSNNFLFSTSNFDKYELKFNVVLQIPMNVNPVHVSMVLPARIWRDHTDVSVSQDLLESDVKGVSNQIIEGVGVGGSTYMIVL